MILSSDARVPLRAPFAITNNAVAFLTLDGRALAYSFGGLQKGKTFRDVTADAFVVDLENGRTSSLPPLPDHIGRLASSAAAINEKIYLFGGYRVAADGAEVSTPDVFVFDARTRSYSKGRPMPLPVDDSVALAFDDRLIYLVSGWSNSGNVPAVQIYDVARDEWRRATDYPGTPVFGHAGGLAGNTFVVFGGVSAEASADGRHKYLASEEAWWGEIDATNPATIHWQRLHAPPVHSRYRIAATASAARSLVVFAGGTERPYNYNGIGYDKIPSQPSGETFAFDLSLGQWKVFGPRRVATMDHRGLIEWKGRFFTIGGMNAKQQVIRDIVSFQTD